MSSKEEALRKLREWKNKRKCKKEALAECKRIFDDLYSQIETWLDEAIQEKLVSLRRAKRLLNNDQDGNCEIKRLVISCGESDGLKEGLEIIPTSRSIAKIRSIKYFQHLGCLHYHSRWLIHHDDGTADDFDEQFFWEMLANEIALSTKEQKSNDT